MCCIRMIHMALREHCQITRKNCIEIRLYRHLKRCCSWLWHGMLASCLTLKCWTMECAKAIHTRSSMDRLLSIPYSSSIFPVTRSQLWFICSSINYCLSELLMLHTCWNCWNSLPDYLKSSDLSFNCFRQQLKTFLFCKYWHQSQHYFSALETLLMRSTNLWYLLTYLLAYIYRTASTVVFNC